MLPEQTHLLQAEEDSTYTSVRGCQHLYTLKYFQKTTAELRWGTELPRTCRSGACSPKLSAGNRPQVNLRGFKISLAQRQSSSAHFSFHKAGVLVETGEFCRRRDKLVLFFIEAEQNREAVSHVWTSHQTQSLEKYFISR